MLWRRCLRVCLKVFNVPLLWVMKGSYFGFGSPQQQVDMHARSKTHSLSYNMHLFLPNLLNDSFFQTPPLRDANLR